MSTPEVTAVVCTYERYDLLPRAIDSLRDQKAAAERFEIVVVDNSPDPARSRAVAAGYADRGNLTWITEKRPGLSNARNVGIGAARAPVVAFMDDDATADPGWIGTIADAFGRFGDEVAIIGGRVDPIWGAPRPSWLDDDLLIYVSVIDWPGRTRDLKPDEWLAGTNVAYRKTALDEIGGFSGSLGRIGGGQSLLSNDETDVAEQLAARGYKTKYVPAMRVDHLVEPARLSQTWFRRRMAWQATSDYLKDPAACFERARRHWEGVTWYFASLPANLRSPAGFLVDEPDPERFRRQLGAIYDMTVATLSGYNGIELETLR